MITFNIGTGSEFGNIVVRFMGDDWHEADTECTMSIEIAGKAVGEPVRIADDYDVEKDQTFLLFLFHDWLDGAYLVPPQRVDVKRLSPLDLAGALSTWKHPYTVDGPPQPEDVEEEDDVLYQFNEDGSMTPMYIPKEEDPEIVY